MYRCILGMSLEKSTALKQMKSFSDVVNEHILKLVVYGDIRKDDIRGWINTIANWIHQADDITLKPKSRKPSEEQIMSSLFRFAGDDIRDYERALFAFKADNLSGKFSSESKSEYPDFEVTSELTKELMVNCDELIRATLPLLRDKNNHSLDEYRNAVSFVFCNK